MRLDQLRTPTRSMTSRLRKCRLALAAAVVCFGGNTVAWAQDDGPAVAPYRPSVATPADLPAPGWPELEAGLSWAKGADAARSLSSPVTFKLAWNESLAILIGTDAYEWQRTYDGSTAHSGGDTALTRWSADRIEDRDGTLLYLRDLDGHSLWSAAWEPLPGAPERYETRWRPGVFEIVRLEPPRDSEVARSSQVSRHLVSEHLLESETE